MQAFLILLLVIIKSFEAALQLPLLSKVSTFVRKNPFFSTIYSTLEIISELAIVVSELQNIKLRSHLCTIITNLTSI